MAENNEQNYPKASKSMNRAGIISYIGCVFLLMAFCGPYWLESYKQTFSEFKNMGLWEVCFENFHYPKHQSTHAFTGCHHVFSLEYNVIREWLLPGWLMFVQAFTTLALILSFSAQILTGMTLVRWPLKFVLNYEWLLTAIIFFCNALASALLFIALLLFEESCWRRDWILLPNFNHLSWSFAFGVIAWVFHGFAAIVLYKDARDQYEQHRESRNLVMQMYPQHERNGYM